MCELRQADAALTEGEARSFLLSLAYNERERAAVDAAQWETANRKRTKLQNVRVSHRQGPPLGRRAGIYRLSLNRSRKTLAAATCLGSNFSLITTFSNVASQSRHNPALRQANSISVASNPSHVYSSKSMSRWSKGKTNDQISTASSLPESTTVSQTKMFRAASSPSAGP